MKSCRREGVRDAGTSLWAAQRGDAENMGPGSLDRGLLSF